MQLAQIRAWLGPVLVREPLEINVVGDIDPHRVMQLVCRYFGHEERRESTAATREVHSFPAGQEQRLQVESSINKAMLTLRLENGRLLGYRQNPPPQSAGSGA